ncbi:MAG TPA: hypothetical protein VN541_03870 [Tepidisphaeraceae bacterium]|nr:hypothetical protein [Tepidisphaeraceae bacterium]
MLDYQPHGGARRAGVLFGVVLAPIVGLLLGIAASFAGTGAPIFIFAGWIGLPLLCGRLFMKKQVLIASEANACLAIGAFAWTIYETNMPLRVASRHTIMYFVVLLLGIATAQLARIGSIPD